jgi:hypothetical protein
MEIQGLKMMENIIDPVCIFHGRRYSEHKCLVCCLCFCDLTPAKCNKLPNGILEDVCQECAIKETIMMNNIKEQ